jgi:predicted nucleic acid-binding Zn ribbon protein
MPLYPFVCSICGHEDEVLLSKLVNTLSCSQCGGISIRQPTFPAMVKIKGEGGYPSRRKFVKGSAPYTSRGTKAWGSHDPSDDIDYMGKS